MIERRTIFSSCRTWRYTLWRELELGNPSYVMFIGLNPSTADEVKDDPTIRRCIDFAKRWGYGALCMTNLFAFRATDPKVMKAAQDPVGPDNDRWLKEIGASAGLRVAAWGAHGTHRARDEAVMGLLADDLSCLALTKDGDPRHPLYLKSCVRPVPFA